MSMSVTGSAATTTHFVGVGASAIASQDVLAEDLGIGEEQGRVPAEEHQARNALRLGMARDVVVALEPVDTAEHGIVGPPGAPDEAEQRQRDGDEDALDHADQRDARGNRRSRARTRRGAAGTGGRRLLTSTSEIHAEITTAPRAALGRFCSSVGAKTSRSAMHDRADHAGQLRLGARRFRHRGARRAAADREALEQPRGHVRRTERNELLVLVDLVAAAQGEGARQHAGVGEGDERDRDRAGQQRGQIGQLTPRGTGTTAGPAAAAPRPRRRPSPPDRTRPTTIVAPTTAISTPGILGHRRLKMKMMARHATPMAKVVQLVMPCSDALHQADRLLNQAVAARRRSPGSWATGR